MERIKQALEKAKAERDAAGGAEPAGARPEGAPQALESAAVPQAGLLQETSIAYSRTRVETPDTAHLRRNLVISEDGDRAGLTAYKMLRTQVLQRMNAQQWNALALTSPAAGDGKTLTAINLAISMARELGQTVLLVDLDLCNPSIHKYLGLAPGPGVLGYLRDGVAMNEVLVNPGIDRLVVMPGGFPVENSSEILASGAVGKLVAEMKSRYPSRMVLFDLPPILATDDALSFAPHVDAFLLVIREGKTTRQEIEHSLELLQNVPVLGTVLNAAENHHLPYYYGR